MLYRDIIMCLRLLILGVQINFTIFVYLSNILEINFQIDDMT